MGRMVRAWHPESPGVRVEVWRPWWRRKRKPFATLSEVLRSYRPVVDATEEPDDAPSEVASRGRCA